MTTKLFPVLCVLVLGVSVTGCDNEDEEIDKFFGKDSGNAVDMRPLPDTGSPDLGNPNNTNSMVGNNDNNDTGLGNCSLADCPPDLSWTSATCSYSAPTLSLELKSGQMLNDSADPSMTLEVTFDVADGAEQLVVRGRLGATGWSCDGFAGGISSFPKPADDAFTCEPNGNLLNITFDTSVVPDMPLGAPFVITDIYAAQKDATDTRQTLTGPSGGPITCD